MLLHCNSCATVQGYYNVVCPYRDMLPVFFGMYQARYQVKKLPDLSKAEYEILRVLWRSGDSTVRLVHDQLNESTDWAYTTTKTHMDRMVKRGLLKRCETVEGIQYRALLSKPEGLANMVRYFAERVLELDGKSVVSMFAKSEALSKQEIKQLRSLLDKNTDGNDD
ncbi:BlaI/MecI/CopY family transcriptional regulator [Pseudoteredinibacter isoporae]|uniref:Putative transcriptional regulator n=1 Tax=Pseudoteredinibacter isoporae TaxID=570281 RepID=A0A7X0JW37_9GAMM|nr:BlaI/MecI/CopY family transcriptional regulator [Pseudoteredinibacter isoporae]MBB6522491.1 putative transcriptional regulator [Pseudoteredinibacter isoporae]NHO88020.1 BlaI/MecI/CopY family transcriptional regulator [Pseudoteredinibacter isoporae]NIB23649.1 BlaI/MecI/CopY family transcriptional regulator [Pseudoteredinibacter isoporae]